MTPDEIAAMVADADDWFRVNGNHPVSGDELAKHVRALAAECERLRRHLDGAQLSLQSVGAVRDHFEAEANEARAQLEAVTRERDRYRAALEHIVEHVQPGVAVNIAREALKGAG